MPETVDLRVLAAGRTDPGRVRDHNEDSVLLAHDLGLFVVADGMGGHATGQIASAAAAASMRNFYEATAGERLVSDAEEDAGLPPSALRLVQSVRKANRDIFEISSTHREHRGMGSTIVAVHLEGSAVTLAHVGDSRCYRIRGGAIRQLTTDHSLLAEALKLKPDLSPAELGALPKNVITRALGMRPTVKVDVQQLELEAGDRLLLCSDGLHGMIDDDAIVEAVGIHEELAESCELLIALANEAGGTDNVSVVLIGAFERGPAEGRARDRQATESVEVSEAIVDDAASAFEGVLPPQELERMRRGEIVEVSVPRCRACGTRIVEGNLFCMECGARVG